MKRKSINDLSVEINENNHVKGFWDKGMDVPQKLMLIVSEVSEAMEADRKDLHSPVIDSSATTNDKEFFELFVKDTYEDELADIAIRLFDLAYEQDINLQGHIELKMSYNTTRPHMHGGKKY